VLRRGARLLAVHRDHSGELHARSAVCTHIGCIVRWNGLERSWDCPCHGSRFGVDGEVLNGPALAPLASTTLEDVVEEPAPPETAVPPAHVRQGRDRARVTRPPDP
jgi:nitrite reductase/ring-hydroxylating ferredoxin subunit